MKKIFLIFGLVFVIVNLWAQTERDTVNVVTPSDISNISAVEDGTLLFTIVGDTVFYKVPASYLRDYITPKWWPDNTPADGQILRYSASGDSMIYAAPQFDSTRLSQDTILLHYLNGLIVNRDTIRGFRSSGSQLDTLGFQGDTGGVIQRSDGENLNISGVFGINTSGAGSTMSIETDTSEVATLTALQDTAAAIRGDFPIGGDGNGIYGGDGKLPTVTFDVVNVEMDSSSLKFESYTGVARDFVVDIYEAGSTYDSEIYLSVGNDDNTSSIYARPDRFDMSTGNSSVLIGPAHSGINLLFEGSDSMTIQDNRTLKRGAAYYNSYLKSNYLPTTIPSWESVQSEISDSLAAFSGGIQDLSYTITTGAIGITGGTGIAIPVMTGATSGSDGEIGLVPKALAGEESLFLRADGTYANPSVGGDNWGGQVVQSDNSLLGDGTSGNQLKVDTSEIASLFALQDSSAAIRADFPVDTDTQLSQEQVEDFAGGMVTGNTETLIAVTYQDGDGTVDFEVNPNLSNYTNDAGFLTSEADGSTSNELQVFDVSQLIGTNLELSLSNDGEATKAIDLSSLQDGTGTDDQQVTTFSINANTLTLEIEDDGQAPHTVDLSPYLDNTDTQLTDEQVEDIVGAMVSGNTETLISVTYDDVNGVYNFVVEGNLSNFTNDAGFLTSEVDGSTSNELQTLSANDTNSELTISSGNTVDLSEFIQEEVFRFLISGTGISLNYDDFSNALEISSTVTGTNFSITADAGGTETISDSELIDFEGDFGVSTLRSSSTINFEVDTSEISTLTALRDSSAAIRADFPSGGTMDGFFLSSGPGDGLLIEDQDTTMFLTLPGLDHTRSGNQIIFDLAFNELSPYNGQFIDTLRLATYNQTTGQHLLLDPASLYNYFIDRIGGFGTDAFGLRIETAFNSGDDASYYFTGASPLDSIRIFGFNDQNYIHSSSSLNIQAPTINLSPTGGGDVRITNTLTTDNTNTKVLAVDPVSKNLEEVDVSSFGGGGSDGNGIFDASNDSGTIPAGFDFSITDLLTMNGEIRIADGTETIFELGDDLTGLPAGTDGLIYTHTQASTSTTFGMGDLSPLGFGDEAVYSAVEHGSDLNAKSYKQVTSTTASNVVRTEDTTNDVVNGMGVSMDQSTGIAAISIDASRLTDQNTYYARWQSIYEANTLVNNRIRGAVSDGTNSSELIIRPELLELDVDGVSVMDLTTSQISLRNYTFDYDQTVGSTQDGHVMIYEHSSTDIGLRSGDKIDIDFVPTYYSRNTVPASVDNIAQVGAHLSGLDLKIDELEPDNVGSQTSGSLDWGAEQGRVIKIDMTGASSKTLTFSNPKNSGVYTVLFLNADDGDTVTWPGAAIYETGAAIGTDALSSGRRMFTMVYDGTNYYITGGY